MAIVMEKNLCLQIVFYYLNDEKQDTSSSLWINLKILHCKNKFQVDFS